MQNNEIKLDRIHGFDAMRGIMMMLGLVLHGAMTYSDISYGNVWPLQDPMNTHHFFHVLIEFIHVFRMPAFFVIAGFFGALLFYKKSPLAMISNRLHRIVYPFFICLLILWPLAVFAFNFSGNIIAGANTPLSNAFYAVFPNGWIPQNTIHLWFLYYLALISFATWLSALFFQQYDYNSSRLKQCFDSIHKSIFIAPIPLSIITFITLYLMGSSSAITSASFIPDVKTFLFYTVFYLYGWILYLSRQLITIFIKPAWLLLLLATFLFIAKMYFEYSNIIYSIYIAMFLNALSVWLYIFSAMGLFLRYASNGSATLRYVSDSAYWVYLIHLPIIAFVAGLITNFDVSAFIKYLTVIITTSIICFVTYHLFVRNTFIGQFLNGRKYPSRTA